MTMLYLHTKFHIYNYHAVLVIAVKTEILIGRGHRLFYFLQKKYLKNVHIFFKSASIQNFETVRHLRISYDSHVALLVCRKL